MQNDKRLIDANALKKPIVDWLEWYTAPVAMKSVAQEIVETIDEAPTIDAVEVVHGRWILERIYRKCSLCEWVFCIRDEEGDLQKFNYCPNCGMPMDGGATDAAD